MKKTRYARISFEEMQSLSKAIALAFSRKYGTPEAIIYVERGGMVFGRLLSDYLGVSRLYGIRARHYPKTNAMASTVHLEGMETLPESWPNDKHILVVDDIADTGKTLNAILSELRKSIPNIATATMLRKPRSIILPDFFGKTLDNDVWAIFDYEEMETGADFKKSGNRGGQDFMRKKYCIGRNARSKANSTAGFGK
ncbi:MAG: hypothetical protein M1128_01385 [Candidatus Marsarchaeota archaeon]|nr:hypothetical protein [Candidatus Marsarchaeota archaeon]